MTNGIALSATDHPMQITDEMASAGGAVITDSIWPQDADLDPQAVARRTYEVMCRAAPPMPEDIADDAVEQVEVEFCLPDDKVEQLAIRAALGNNGGTWAEHYTEAQKEHWRQWVRDMADMALAARFEMRRVQS